MAKNISKNISDIRMYDPNFERIVELANRCNQRNKCERCGKLIVCVKYWDKHLCDPTKRISNGLVLREVFNGKDKERNTRNTNICKCRGKG